MQAVYEDDNPESREARRYARAASEMLIGYARATGITPRNLCALFEIKNPVIVDRMERASPPMNLNTAPIPDPRHAASPASTPTQVPATTEDAASLRRRGRVLPAWMYAHAPTRQQLIDSGVSAVMNGYVDTADNALSGLLTAGRIAPLSRQAMRSADCSPLGALRLSRGQQCAQRIAHRWAHCASLAASNALSGLLTAERIAPLSRPAMRSADCSPLGAPQLSRGQQCAQRIAHRWAHCASLAASNALSTLLTAGRITALSRPAMRSADCSPLSALRLSRGQQCAQRIAHR
ncbi:unnamed protein product [Closterium sp. NIES-65]|nr:unnamed protein product [Closterium sp. NIES-65]